MIERVLTFLVIGFFVFTPQIQSFWSEDPISWYSNYVVWFALILLCLVSVWRETRTSHGDDGE